MAQEQKVFNEIEINETNKLVFSLVKEDDELTALDIRTWFINDDKWTPTKRGVRIKKGDIVDVMTSIIEALGDDIKSDILSNLEM